MTRGDTDIEATLIGKLGKDWRGALDGLISRQLELYGELDALSGQQRGLIDEGDADRLVGLLGERGRIVEAIAETTALFEPFSRCWDEVTRSLDEAALRDVQRRLDAVAALAEGVARRDAADGEAIGARRDELADRLAGLRRSKSAISAYAGPPRFGARYQDREG
ncbi:MAG TPA: flagellar protein FliT [Phycisphaerales bacterium]|nr:flagellar protein FliT [Phycisphaerales bacterium]